MQPPIQKILKYSKSISYIFWGILFVYYLAIRFGPAFLLHGHIQYIFNWISLLQRRVIVHFPIAIGEWMYLIILFILLLKFMRTIKDMVVFGFQWQKRGKKFIKFVWSLFTWWLVFELIWGIGYHLPNPPQMGAFKEEKTYSVASLDDLSKRLIQKMNALRAQIPDVQVEALDFETAKKMAIETYQDKAPYPQPVLKKAVFPSLGDYIGYTAFYQPFTSEAIVRADTPPIEWPFTMLHEMAHQNGIASEQAANFNAFMIAKNAKAPLVQYALCLQLFTYAQQAILSECIHDNQVELFSKMVLQYKQLLSAAVIKDRKQIKAFWRLHSGLQIEASEIAYDQFLKWHQQAAGLHSYNEVLLWIIGYEASFGKQF